MAKSNYLKTKEQDYLFGKNSWTPPNNIYLRLYTTIPNLDGSAGVEVDVADWTNYEPQVLTSSDWNNAATSADITTTSNTTEIQFGISELDPGVALVNVVAAALWDAASGGNMLHRIPLVQTVPVLTGVPIVIPIGYLFIRGKECSV